MKTRMTIVAALIFAAFAFAGCATSPIDFDANGVASASKVGRDDFKKYTSVQTPGFRFTPPQDSIGDYRYVFSAEKLDAEREPRYFINIQSMSGNWVFWKEMADQNGKIFPLVSASREVSREGLVSETSYAIVDRAFLVRISSGEKLAFYGDRIGGVIVPILPNSVAGFLSKCDATFGAHKSIANQ